MSRRSLQSFKDSSTVKTPHIAWLWDRKIIYVISMTVAAIFIGSFLWKGYATYQHIITPPKVSSQYMSVSAKNSPGMSWARTFIAKKPPTVTTWNVNESKKPIHLFNNCSAGNIPSTLLGGLQASGNSTTTTVQIYGSGQAVAQFDAYKKMYRQCFTHFSDDSSSSTKLLKFDNGFVMSMGDAMVGVLTSDNTGRDKMISFYESEMRSSLLGSNCLSLSETAADATRSFYFNAARYKGFFKRQTVSTKVDINNLAVPQKITLASVDNDEVQQPEGPLPEGFPKLPRTVQRPTIPSTVKTVDHFDETAQYKIADENGAGCGWVWSGQTPPVYDTTKLADDKKDALAEAQQKIDSLAESYVSDKRNWAYQVMTVLPQADQWNAYVKNVNAVHSKWSWLNTQREIIEPAWNDYVAAHDEWFTFDARQKAASDSYDKALQKCKTEQDALTEWEKKYGNSTVQQPDSSEPESVPSPSAVTAPSSRPAPSAGPTPSSAPTSSVPPMPSGCTTVPERPLILDQQRGPEPTAPKIPDGATIPNSWPKPRTS